MPLYDSRLLLLAKENRPAPSCSKADYEEFCVTAPTDSRLPASVSGQQICGLYDLKQEKFGQVNNLQTQSSHYGDQSEVYNGFDATLNARFAQGGVFQGGISVGRTTTDNCFVVDSPEVLRDCRITTPWGSATQVKFLVVYPLPWGLHTSAIYQNIPGMPINTTYAATNAEIRPSLGRNLAGRTTAIFNLVPPNTVYEPRLQQVDVRVSRVFALRGTRLTANLDLYNVFNASNVLNQTTRWGPAWGNVVQVMGGRLLKFGGEINF